MAADTHERVSGLTRFRAVTPGTTSLAVDGVYPRALQVAAAGTVTGKGVDDEDALEHYYAAGIWHPVCFKEITAAGATGLIVGY